MHDVDVRLILIVHLIQNQLVLQNIYFRIHGIVIVKLETKSDNSFRKKNWAIKIWKILENKGEVLVF